MAQNEKAKEDQKNGRLLLLTTGQNPLFSDHIIGLKKKSDLEMLLHDSLWVGGAFEQSLGSRRMLGSEKF